MKFALTKKCCLNIHTHTHTHIYIYIYIYILVEEIKSETKMVDFGKSDQMIKINGRMD